MKLKNFALFTLAIISFLPIAIAQETGGELMLLGLELEKLLSFVIGLLAIILFFITIIAYKRDGRKRLLFVSMAFLLFAVKGFLASSELFIPEFSFIDPIAVLLEFIIILCFFFGILKK